MVVSTPDDRLGQAIHRPPDGKIIRASASIRRSNSRRAVKKATTTSAEPRAWRFTVTPGGRPEMTPAGAPTSARVEPSVIPSFLGSGVPLYPAAGPGRAHQGLTARKIRKASGYS